jgi:hypothetical protein
MTVTKELIAKIVNGENVTASDEVIDILYNKAISQLDDYKQQVASSLMNSTEESTEETTEDEQ